MDVAWDRTCVDHSISLSRVAVSADVDVAFKNQLTGKGAGAQSHTVGNGMRKLRVAERQYLSRNKNLQPQFGIANLHFEILIPPVLLYKIEVQHGLSYLHVYTRTVYDRPQVR